MNIKIINKQIVKNKPFSLKGLFLQLSHIYLKPGEWRHSGEVKFTANLFNQIKVTNVYLICDEWPGFFQLIPERQWGIFRRAGQHAATGFPRPQPRHRRRPVVQKSATPGSAF
ncbi:TPA: hypothetical protein ACRTM4_001246 [Aeromonas hydrophila]|uniref:hypothetical protein n=1 Tax=Aeromonas TaxID=642 RepID=UPI000A7CEE88|nr:MULTISPECIES: hypothetical protein [Aeromonas]HEB4991354.1 hypothetical protein [Aeromonas hydrophila subsp. hydrophila]MBW3845735.1 hypothetical protein [Aeromonas hydrophila]MCK0184571.1 hypothetical protein [Aeromonas hydrophila]UCM57158.1 hypothetical protein LEO74_19380 [Aeromonas hydrophila]UOV91616.1 hypothetical protein MUW98_20700 [Aeromonas hydrophila]